MQAECFTGNAAFSSNCSSVIGVTSIGKGNEDQYSEEEAQRRFVAAVKAGLNTKPKPLKSITPKGVLAQSKKK
jgi:hypothetical protein